MSLTNVDYRWLIRKGRIEEAKKALLRLTTKENVDLNVDQTLL
jgi:hypothetical protein